MPQSGLEAKVAALEAEVPRLKALVEKATKSKEPDWKKVVGIFANDPLFLEAMRLGREYRESTRPRSRNPNKL